MQPFINRIYNDTSKSLFKIKADKSAVTLADTIVQSCLRKLLTPYVETFIGEEQIEYDFEHHRTLEEEPTVVNDKVLQNEITDALRRILSLKSKPASDIRPLNLIAIVDPIDGTSEFTKKKGHESTICIGFAKIDIKTKRYVPEAGFIFRPIYRFEQPEYAIGCRSEHFAQQSLFKERTNANASHGVGFLTSNGQISPFLQALISKGYTQVCSGGCGNKTLMLLEGKGNIYLQDRGVSRWDTCAAQAILEANGGVLCKLTDFIDRYLINSYDYAKSDLNLDANPLALFGRMNVREENTHESTPIGQQIERVKPYSNICGIVAVLDTGVMETLKSNIDSLNIKPSYN